MRDRYHDLKVAMYAKGVSQKVLADELGLSQATMSSKLNNKTPITLPEAIKIQESLDLSRDDAMRIFFGQ